MNDNDTSFTQSRTDDRAMILALAHRYAHTARDGMDFADIVPLFTDDAQIKLPDGTSLPPTELVKVVRGEEAGFIRHHITTVDIRFHGPNDATADVMFFAITNEAAPDHWGYWGDALRRQSDGTWRIHERSINVDGGTPGGWFARMYLND